MRLAATFRIRQPGRAIFVRWHIDRRVGHEEVRRSDHQLEDLHGHDRPIFNTWVMCDAKGVPHNHVSVCHRVASTNGISFLALAGAAAVYIIA